MLDIELARAMLRLGANVDGEDQGFLVELWWQYSSARSMSGAAIMAMLSLLLDAGANPDRVGCNNFRAVDLAMSAGHDEVAGLLLGAGAHATPREFL